MKYLKIERNKAFFINPEKLENEEWIEIDKIDKDILFNLMNIALTDEFSMDTYDESLIANKAHQIIYKNLHDKFVDLKENITRFADESSSIFSEAMSKYKLELGEGT